jgi:hypothetical protein
MERRFELRTKKEIIITILLASLNIPSSSSWCATSYYHSIFLNFAALGFLQSIDDVAFTLADQGFFGDRMQKNCEIVRRAKFPKLDGSLLVASLDSILYALTCLALFGVYAFVLIEADNHVAE